MKRFYTQAGVAPVEGGWQVTLDARPIKTVGGRAQIVPSHALAEAMAQEWAAQGEKIEAASLVLRDLADYAIDVVSANREEAIAAILPYGETDTLCYRAEPGEALHRRQLALWEPLLAAAEARHGVRFERVSGIIHRPQPAETLAHLRAVVTQFDAFALVALRNTTSLAASLVLGLAALEAEADGEALWQAAYLEEDWQAQQWGADAEAEDRRERRRQAFLTAMRFAALSRAA